MRYLTLVLLAVGTARADDPVNGGGSSFVNPLMAKWSAAFEAEAGVRINYQSVGSSAGIQKMTTRDFEFGCTDALLIQDAKHQKAVAAGELLYVPLVMGGIVPIYNLPDAGPLNFSGDILADIFMGRLTNWNDPKLVALNPQAKLPDKQIVAVRRSDGSGSTFIFSTFLAKTSRDWRTTIGLGNTLKWSDATVGAKGTEGVAGQVNQTVGAIGYVELTHALQAKLTFGAVENRQKEMVTATKESVTAAAANFFAARPVDHRFQFSLADAPGPGSYPISGATWAVLYAKGAKPEVVRFLRGAAGPRAQQMAADLDYAPLPSALADAITKRLDGMR
ncbi:MAG: phosphate ABC transporter substrate-binding protein PstS [Gemmataceae bacterium]